MSDRRHRSTLPALPEGYQYGENAAKCRFETADIFVLSCRPYNALRNAKVNSFADLRNWTSTQFKQLKNFGWHSFREVKRAAAAVGVHLTGPYAWEAKIARLDGTWRAPHENAAAQLTRQSISSLRAPVSNAAESAFSDQADKGQQDQDNGEWGGDQAFPALRVHTSGILTQRTGDETV